MGKGTLERDGLKVCFKCGEELPATEQYWAKDATKADGWRGECKVCRAEARKVADDRAVLAKVEQMDVAAMKLIDNLTRGGSDVPHMVELYQRLMEAFDGVGGFAQHYMANYLCAKPGSSIREKMMATIIRMGTQASEQGLTQVPLDLLQDEDLQIYLREKATDFLKVRHPEDQDEHREAS